MFERTFFARTPIPELYEWFATETAPTSPIWRDVSLWVAATPEVQALLDTLPGTKRQPNLFLAALKYYEAPITDPGELAAWVRANWGRVEALILARATQTNEPGRCAVLAPVIASLQQPVALIEVGPSAGACLMMDHYQYRWTGDVIEVGGADGGPVIESLHTGRVPVLGVPEVAWRVGIDLNPLSATNPDDVRWLRSLVWPGEDAREQRLADCLEVVRQDPPRIVTGDAIDLLPQVLAEVPAGLTPVVYHSAVLAYFHRDDRRRFVDLVADLGVHWVSLEGAKVVPGIADRLPSEVPEPAMAVSLDGRPLCWTQHHGAWVDWFGR